MGVVIHIYAHMVYCSQIQTHSVRACGMLQYADTIMEYTIIFRSIPPSTLYTISASLFAISVASILFLIIRIVWDKLAKNEILKYEFITIVAHKFRTPLTHIKWASSELLTSEQDPYRQQTIRELQESNDKLIKLTNTLIEITDTDSGTSTSYEFSPVSLSELMQAAGSSFKDEFHAKNVFFTTQPPVGDAHIMIDRNRMDFVLQTLLENALHYTSPGKNVALSARIVGKKVQIAVTDQGIGIKKEDLPLIFSKFFRTEDAQRADTEGFGVGLYLASTIIRRHKGSITVDSPGVGQGTTFTVTLKRAS